MRVNPKQNTSIYSEGTEFSNIPISTGNTAIFIPKPVDKYTEMIKRYELKQENKKLMNQPNRQKLIADDPKYDYNPPNNHKHSESNDSTSYCIIYLNK